MENEKTTQRCETCNYCKYPRTTDDNNGACKCKLMQYKTIDIIVTGGGSPAWCPLKRLAEGRSTAAGGRIRFCCICGNAFEGYGYNPVPIVSTGVCCRACNDNLVIPRRLRDYEIARIQQEADALRTNTPNKHASAKLNAFVGKPVIVKFWDGSTERGVLHIDTVAAHLHSAGAARADNTRVIGYYLARGRELGYLHFKKTHIVNIALDSSIAPPLPAIYLCNGENTHCSKINCVYSGGGCKYTTNIDYAVNAIKRTPPTITAADSADNIVYYDDEKMCRQHGGVICT